MYMPPPLRTHIAHTAAPTNQRLQQILPVLVVVREAIGTQVIICRMVLVLVLRWLLRLCAISVGASSSVKSRACEDGLVL
jgi:hypothetical protein